MAKVAILNRQTRYQGILCTESTKYSNISRLHKVQSFSVYMQTLGSFNELPDELIVLIARYLCVVDQYFFKQSCRRIFWLLERSGIASATEWTSIGLYYHADPLFDSAQSCDSCGEIVFNDDLCKCITGIVAERKTKYIYYLERKNACTKKEEKTMLCEVYLDTEKRLDLGVPHPRNFDWRTFVAVTHMTTLVSYDGCCPEIIVRDRRVPDRVIRVLIDGAKHSDSWSLKLCESWINGLTPDTLMMLAHDDGLQKLTIKRDGTDIFSSFSDEFFEASRSHLQECVLDGKRYTNCHDNVGYFIAVYMKNVTDKSIDIWNQYFHQIRLDFMVVTNCTLNAIIQLIQSILEKRSSLSKFPLHFGYVCVPFSSLSESTFPFAYKEEVGWFPGTHRDSAIRNLSVEGDIHFGIIDTCCSDSFFLAPCTHLTT